MILSKNYRMDKPSIHLSRILISMKNYVNVIQVFSGDLLAYTINIQIQYILLKIT
jgi:hypothetical protein